MSPRHRSSLGRSSSTSARTASRACRFPWTSEMTATRMVRIATIAAAVALWMVAAWLLWRTSVPGDLRLPHLDPDRVFGARLVRRADAYGRFYDVTWILATLARVGVLVVLVRRLPPLAPRLDLGRVNAGIVLGVVTVVAVAAA